MLEILPQEQDKLLKQFNDLEIQERSNIIPEKGRIDLVLVFIICGIGSFITIIDLLTEQYTYAIGVVLSSMMVIIPLLLARSNSRLGFYLSSIAAILINIYVTYLHYLSPGLYADLTTVIDGLMILTLANQFEKKGYYVGAILVFIKSIFSYFYIPYTITIIGAVVSYVNALVIGIIPLLIFSIAKAVRTAKKEKIRAEILSLQNQDLIKGWESYSKPKD